MKVVERMNELVVRSEAPLPQVHVREQSTFVPNSAQKAAIVLSVLEPDEAAAMLREFDENTIAKFASAVMGLRPITADVMEAVIIEFLEHLGDGNGVRGGAAQARRLLGNVLEEAELERIIDRIENPEKGAVWRRMNSVTTDEALSFVQLEHPQTATYILSRMRADRAAAILENMERDFAQGIIMRMANAPQLEAKIVSMIETIISKDFLSVISQNSSAIKPAEIIGNLMNNVSSTVRDQFLEHIQGADGELAAEVIKVMFTFADIASRVAANEVAKFVKDVEEERLLVALRYSKDTDNPSFDFIMSNLSKRLSERLNEEVDAMDTVKDKDGEAAQMETVAVIQKKAKTGEITLIEIDPED